MINMNKIALIGLLTMTASCGSIMGMAGKYIPTQEAPTAAKSYTRASIDKANIAAVRVFFGPQDRQGRFYFAQNVNGPYAIYGNDQRTTLILDGGLIVEAYGWGSDLLGVAPNANDPIMNQRPIAQWPSHISRTYRVFGDSPNGKLLNVECTYAKIGASDVEVLDVIHAATHITEDCSGDRLAFTNTYSADANGFIWKSEQWAGNNPLQAILEIIEPLD